MTTCPACDGHRTYEVQTRAMHGGERCGKAITLDYPCEWCNAAGVVSQTTADIYNELERIDEAKGVHDPDAYADLYAWHEQNIAAGLPPY